MMINTRGPFVVPMEPIVTEPKPDVSEPGNDMTQVPLVEAPLSKKICGDEEFWRVLE